MIHLRGVTHSQAASSYHLISLGPARASFFASRPINPMDAVSSPSASALRAASMDARARACTRDFTLARLPVAHGDDQGQCRACGGGCVNAFGRHKKTPLSAGLSIPGVMLLLFHLDVFG
jgi:hypothetical protein